MLRSFPTSYVSTEPRTPSKSMLHSAIISAAGLALTLLVLAGVLANYIMQPSFSAPLMHLLGYAVALAAILSGAGAFFWVAWICHRDLRRLYYEVQVGRVVEREAHTPPTNPLSWDRTAYVVTVEGLTMVGHVRQHSRKISEDDWNLGLYQVGDFVDFRTQDTQSIHTDQ